VNLDEPDRFGEVDPAGALADLEAAGAAWTEAGTLAVPEPDLAGVSAVVVAGVGGSGIAGDVVAALAGPVLDMPIVVHKGYGLPAFAGPRTLVVAVSHSGDTAETLDAAGAALERGAALVAVTGGGRLAALCAGAGAAVVAIPQRTPPRHALPLLVLPVLRLLGLDGGFDDAVAAVDAAVATAARDVPIAENPAKVLALQLAGPGPVTVLGASGVAAVAAYRFACQLAENAKVQAAHGQVPEAAHNVVAAWAKQDGPAGIVLVRDPEGEAGQLGRQVEAVADLARDSGAWTAELHPRGGTPLGRLASLVAFVDLASVYTALVLDRDPTPIDAIQRIKEATGR
jgi:glucose/mannose-6-phosphate isomerase